MVGQDDQAMPVDDQLVVQALQFLRGTKTSEYMSDALRQALYVPRRLSDGRLLEPLLAGVLRDGRSVLIAGSAGGGKTMMLSRVSTLLTDVDVAPRRSKSNLKGRAEKRNPILVPDLTAVEGDRSAILKAARNEAPLLLAANEGVLLDTDLPGDLQASTETLRQLQLGQRVERDHDAVVVDLAGLDPVMDALPELLRHPVLHKAVEVFDDGCGEVASCPRRQALEQLRFPNMAEVLAQIIHSAIGPGELLFRDVWDFISDILLGGTCDSEVPSSPWFWRAFFGDSAVAASLRDALSPSFLSSPRISPYLFRGDWQIVDELVGSQPGFVVPGNPPISLVDPAARRELMRWLRLQSILLVRRGGGAQSARFLGELATTLEDRVSRRTDVRALVQALNAYFKRIKPSAADGTALDLWVEMSVERATNRAKALVSLGQVSSTRLQVVRSQVVGNLSGVSQEGSRLYLSSDEPGPEKPLLVLDFKLFRALAHGRPVATSDRSGDDADFAIRQFIIEVGSVMELEDDARIALISWDRSSTAAEYAWRVLSDEDRIELVL